MTAAECPIVVVDDDADLREAVVDTLADEGFATIPLNDGPSLLSYLRRGPLPRLVLLDWNMAPMNGAQVMAEVAKERAWAPVVFVLLTADARAEDKARMAGIKGFLKKPVSVPELLEVAERYCA
ncbi:MAG: response regulator [Myxococcales bacterium]